MPRFAITALLAVLAAAVLAAPAPAQEDEEAAGPSYYNYAGPGWGVEVSLLDNGTLREPGDPEWARDDLDWLWLSEGDVLAYPIYQVDGGTVGRDGENPDGVYMTDAEFDEFYASMLVTLGDDPSLVILESDANHLTSDGRRWQMFHTEEHQDGGTADGESDDVWLNYYSFFTLDNGVLRLINFYYEPLGEDDDFLTAMEVMMAIDIDFEGDSYDM